MPKTHVFRWLLLNGSFVALWLALQTTLAAQFVSGPQSGGHQAKEGSKGTYIIEFGGKPTIGTPLAWDDTQILLLDGFGSVCHFHLGKVSDFKKRSSHRWLHGHLRFQESLEREFGRNYRVSRTNDCIVVHPIGQSDYWPSRIQQAHQALRSNLEARRIKIGKSDYPLVTIVFSSKVEFQQNARKNKESITDSVVGYYSAKSNRIYTYDQTGNGQWNPKNRATIFHELTHQLAFNCKLHTRMSHLPTWAAEGLGTYYETFGDSPGTRIRPHGAYLDSFRQSTLSHDNAGWLKSIIMNDRLFDDAPVTAYAQAWALTYFLLETRPYDYASYTDLLGQLKALHHYPKQQRLNDFQKCFGSMRRLEDAVRGYFARM